MGIFDFRDPNKRRKRIETITIQCDLNEIRINNANISFPTNYAVLKSILGEASRIEPISQTKNNVYLWDNLGIYSSTADPEKMLMLLLLSAKVFQELIIFATVTRGGVKGNMNYTRKVFKRTFSDTTYPETIRTTLPKTFENSNAKYYGKYFETEEAKKGYTIYHYKDSTTNNKQLIDSTITNFEQKDKAGYYKSNPLEYKGDKQEYDRFI